MNSTAYQEYVSAWTSHRSEHIQVIIPESISEPILSNLYRIYADFAFKNRMDQINLINEKFIYDRQLHRHGFRSIFQIKDNHDKVENIRLVTHIRPEYQKILFKYRAQFKTMAKTIFGPDVKIKMKVRCNPETRKFIMHVYIINV
jgi:replicative superfamily II helicase